MDDAVHLKTFHDSELILSKEETCIILEFFFPKFKDRIDESIITNDMREFAQGLLVESIDASYAMGYVDVLVSAIATAIISPSRVPAPVTIIKSFAQDASGHWFKHATAVDRINVKIYEMVRVKISESFDIKMFKLLSGLAVNKPYAAFIEYADISSCRFQKVWS